MCLEGKEQEGVVAGRVWEIVTGCDLWSPGASATTTMGSPGEAKGGGVLLGWDCLINFKLDPEEK